MGGISWGGIAAAAVATVGVVASVAVIAGGIAASRYALFGAAVGAIAGLGYAIGQDIANGELSSPEKYLDNIINGMSIGLFLGAIAELVACAYVGASMFANMYVANRRLGLGGQSNAPHGNSKTSTKPQHGYEISEKATGDVAKTGISGQKLNKDGTSPRANSQVNKWNKEAGYDKYEAHVVKDNMPDRQSALDWENDNAQRLWEEGNSMNKHQRPKPWED